MKKILILFAHPAIKRSKINAALREAVENIEGITYHDLYASYPDFHIDVVHEQRLCETNDIIVFQHPFYWYSTPAIFKEWMDLVLEHNWAYGSTGRALEGKTTFQALTAGGDSRTYHKKGSNLFSIKEFTAPFRATANLCRMEWLPPFAVLGVHRGLSAEELYRHAEEYRRIVIALRDDNLDFKKASKQDLLNQNLNVIIKGA